MSTYEASKNVDTNKVNELTYLKSNLDKIAPDFERDAAGMESQARILTKF